MTFKEELHKEIDSWDVFTVFKMQVEESILNIKKKHCLDKQRVKEVIDKQWGATTEHKPIDGNYLYLIRELGLKGDD